MKLKDIRLAYQAILAPETEENIMICLHGYGSSKEDLISLVPYFKEDLPNTTFISVDAPFLCDRGLGSFQWFPIEITDNAINIRDYKSVLKSTIIIDNFINYISKKHNLPINKITLFGFSQGAIISLLYAMRTKNTLGAVFAHSGAFYIDNYQIIAKKPQNILLLHGKDDEIIGFNHFLKTMDYLEKANLNYKAFYQEDLNHSVSQASMEQIIAFFKEKV